MTRLLATIVGLSALLAASFTPARADSGTVRISFIKAGIVIGGAIGSGTLTFRGRTYPLAIGGLSYGFHLRWLTDQSARPRQQHQSPAGHRRCLWGCRRRRHRDPRAASDCTRKPEWCRTRTQRHTDRSDGQPRSQRLGAKSAAVTIADLTISLRAQHRDKSAAGLKACPH